MVFLGSLLEISWVQGDFASNLESLYFSTQVDVPGCREAMGRISQIFSFAKDSWIFCCLWRSGIWHWELWELTNWGCTCTQPTPKIDETIKHLFDFAGTWTCCFHGWKLTETDGSLLTGATHGNLPPASALPLPSATLKVFPGRGYGGDMPVNRRCQC